MIRRVELDVASDLLPDGYYTDPADVTNIIHLGTLATPRFTRNCTELLVLPQSPPFTAANPIWVVISSASFACLSSLGLSLQLVSGLIRLGLK